MSSLDYTLLIWDHNNAGHNNQLESAKYRPQIYVLNITSQELTLITNNFDVIELRNFKIS